MRVDAVHNRPEQLKTRKEPMTLRQYCVLSLRSRRPSRSGKQLESFDLQLNTTLSSCKDNQP
jgi:hypothetical protein